MKNVFVKDIYTWADTHYQQLQSLERISCRAIIHKHGNTQINTRVASDHLKIHHLEIRCHHQSVSILRLTLAVSFTDLDG